VSKRESGLTGYLSEPFNLALVVSQLESQDLLIFLEPAIIVCVLLAVLVSIHRRRRQGRRWQGAHVKLNRGCRRLNGDVGIRRLLATSCNNWKQKQWILNKF
jgi:hypothetical protein